MADKNGAPQPPGFWSEESVGPHQNFLAAGLIVKVATPSGIKAMVDPPNFKVGLNNNDAGAVESQKKYLQQVAETLNKPLTLEDVKPGLRRVFSGWWPRPDADMAVHPTIGS